MLTIALIIAGIKIIHDYRQKKKNGEQVSTKILLLGAGAVVTGIGIGVIRRIRHRHPRHLGGMLFLPQ